MIITESGRATVAYSSVLLFNILDVTGFEPGERCPSGARGRARADQEPARVAERASTAQDLQECYNDAIYYREEIRELFSRGQIRCATLSLAENIFLRHRRRDRRACSRTSKRMPAGLRRPRASRCPTSTTATSRCSSRCPTCGRSTRSSRSCPIHRLNEAADAPGHPRRHHLRLATARSTSSSTSGGMRTHAAAARARSRASLLPRRLPRRRLPGDARRPAQPVRRHQRGERAHQRRRHVRVRARDRAATASPTCSATSSTSRSSCSSSSARPPSRRCARSASRVAQRQACCEAFEASLRGYTYYED